MRQALRSLRVRPYLRRVTGVLVGAGPDVSYAGAVEAAVTGSGAA
ncbi:hypothetical protein ACWGLF_20305 [Streptomyces puniciscabiei]